jgi:hypothetical protein
MTEVEFCWDRIKHEEDLFTSRANFFLVGESMLLVGVATLLTSHEPPHNAIQVFCWAGLLSTVLWSGVNLLQRNLSWKPLRERLRALGAVKLNQWKADADNGLEGAYAKLREYASSKWYRWIKGYALMGYCVPILLIVAWTVLLLDLPTANEAHDVLITFDRVVLVGFIAGFAGLVYWLRRRLKAIEADLAGLRKAGAPKVSTG